MFPGLAHPPSILGMIFLRMDHAVVVDNPESAPAFFVERAMDLEGRMPIDGPSVNGLSVLDDVRADIAMILTPDAHGGLEPTKTFRGQPVRSAESIIFTPAEALK